LIIDHSLLTIHYDSEQRKDRHPSNEEK